MIFFEHSWLARGAERIYFISDVWELAKAQTSTLGEMIVALLDFLHFECIEYFMPPTIKVCFIAAMTHCSCVGV